MSLRADNKLAWFKCIQDIHHRMLQKKCAPEVGPSYGFVYVDQEGFEQYKPQSLAALLTSICEYQVAP